MTAITPPISMQDDADVSQPMVDLTRRLSNPMRLNRGGPVVTFFQALISIGLLPLVLWPARWSAYVESERNDLLQLASLWRRRVDADQAGELDKITRRFRPRPMLMVIPWLAVGFVAFSIIPLFCQGESPRHIWDLTVNRHSPTQQRTVQIPVSKTNWRGERYWSSEPYVIGLNESPINPLEANLYRIWLIGLLVGYCFQWYAVRSHAVAVNDLVQWTNHQARANDFSPVKINARRLGLSPLWIVAGFFLCAPQAWWAIPMVLTGSLQRRYMSRSSADIRIALANHAGEAFALLQPHGDHFCTEPQCGARLPDGARFCPRCGRIADAVS